MQRPASVRNAIMAAGISAGILSTLMQAVLWLAFTNDFPALLLRDAQLTAALLLGNSVLPPPVAFDPGVMLTATLIHFTLSIAYAALLARLTARLGTGAALLAGAGCGGVIYIVNLYGCTLLFPWFAQARSWMACVAHVTFGMAAVLTYRWLRRTVI